MRMSAIISVVETYSMEICFVQYGNRNDAGALIDVLFEDESCDFCNIIQVLLSSKVLHLTLGVPA